MALSNEIILRPRFRMEFNQSNSEILRRFKIAKETRRDFLVQLVDDHVFIKFPKEKQNFWTPQLHLEVIFIDQDKCTLHGLFGPRPAIWTLFMFLHFVVAGLFIGFAIWTYVNWKLDADFTLQLFGTIMMVLFWWVLYFAGRLGRHAGKGEMVQLHNFLYEIVGDQL